MSQRHHHDLAHSSVPVTAASLSCTYCHECQAWRIIWWCSELTTDDSSEPFAAGVLDLGPFDGIEQLLEHAGEILRRMITGTGGPWVSAPSF